MGCCSSKDDSGSTAGEYSSHGGVNSRPVSAMGTRNNREPSTRSSTDINTPQISLTGSRTSSLLNTNVRNGGQRDIQSRERNLALRNTEQGSVPLTRESWYFGKIDIARCSKVLGDRSVPDGTFIVRESTSQNGKLCLSVKGRSPNGPAVFNVRLTESNDRFGDKKFRSSIDTKVFPSVHDVIRYYQEYGLNSNGYSMPVREGLQILNHHYYMEEDGEENRSIEIKSKDIELKKKIGKGNFGNVYKGVWKKADGERVHVAVKQLIRSDREELKNFEKEVNVLKMVYHDNIVTLLGICVENDEEPLIVTELLSKGDLSNFLRKNKKTPLEDLYYFAHKVASGMKFLASLSIIHRDLAARNVLLGEQHIVKIADFGLSRVLKEDEIYASTTVKLPVKWTAPEGLEYPYHFTTKSDVWSYGIFLTELITRGREPYHREDKDEITKDRLIYQGYRMQREYLGSDCSRDLYRIMENCWQSDPDERPNFVSVAEDIQRLYEPYAPLHHC